MPDTDEEIKTWTDEEMKTWIEEEVLRLSSDFQVLLKETMEFIKTNPNHKETIGLCRRLLSLAGFERFKNAT